MPSPALGAVVCAVALACPFASSHREAVSRPRPQAAPSAETCAADEGRRGPGCQRELEAARAREAKETPRSVIAEGLDDCTPFFTSSS